MVVGCLAHARRYFDQALKAIPQKERVHSGPMIGKRFCDKLFAIERDLAELNTEERYLKRLELAKPVMDDFLAWMHSLGEIAKNETHNHTWYKNDDFHG